MEEIIIRIAENSIIGILFLAGMFYLMPRFDRISDNIIDMKTLLETLAYNHLEHMPHRIAQAIKEQEECRMCSKIHREEH